MDELFAAVTEINHAYSLLHAPNSF